MIRKHILFIAVFLLIPMLVSTRPPGEPFLTITGPFIRDVIGNVLLLAFFYLNYYLLVPKLYFSKKYGEYASILILCLAVIFIVPSLMTGRLTVPEGPSMPAGVRPLPPGSEDSGLYVLFTEVRHHFYLFFIALFFSFLLRFREHLAEIKEEKLKAELASLKSQINPHFLFNTLNSIYSLSIRRDERASDAILNLSSLMRYVIRDAGNDRILLCNELNYIKSYVELQQARLGRSAGIRFEISGDPGDLEIAPLILITYIENAFKHGINPDIDDCRIDIGLQVIDDGIQLHVVNKKVHVSTGLHETGIGEQNTAERLKRIYPARHSLSFDDKGDTYSVTLSITLT
ncbi:MAG TPA: sensor histidine kinase [Puia sp.]|nr:sensor histidine kinase [Puia sp.]